MKHVHSWVTNYRTPTHTQINVSIRLEQFKYCWRAQLYCPDKSEMGEIKHKQSWMNGWMIEQTNEWMNGWITINKGQTRETNTI